MNAAVDTVRPGTYRHYKGMMYQVLGVARHSEAPEFFVVYQALYGDHKLWARPVRMFLEHVIRDGKEVPRFQFVEEQC